MTQNFDNHAKFVPGFHVLVLGILAINLIWSIYRFFHVVFSRVHDFIVARNRVRSPRILCEDFRARRTGSFDPTRDASSDASNLARGAAPSHP